MQKVGEAEALLARLPSATSEHDFRTTFRVDQRNESGVGINQG
jgi:hypothetical protein